jgi:hypothetical protein
MDYEPISPAPEKYATAIQKWLTKERHHVTIGPASALMDFVDVNETRPVCEECHGTGTIECDECDGTGTIDCTCRACGDEHTADCEHCTDGKADCEACAAQRRQKPTLILGSRMDARRVRTALRVAHPDRAETIQVSFTGSGEIMLIDPVADSAWRVVVMGLNNTVTPIASFEWPVSDNAVDPAVATGHEPSTREEETLFLSLRRPGGS